MITNNKIAALALIGVVVGLLLGLLVNPELANIVSFGALGGIVGFLAGWIWNTRSAQ